MRFQLTEEQRGFAASLRDLMRDADSVRAARQWATGDRAAGLGIWHRLAEQGVSALVIPEEYGGLGGTLVDMCVAFDVLGHELAVGPWIESAVFLSGVLSGGWAEGLAEGSVMSVAAPPHSPYALDADLAEVVFVAAADGTLRPGTAGTRHTSVDTTRSLFEVEPGEGGAESHPDALARAHDRASLACAAQLLGCGERLLADTVDYVKQRRQYGRVIGSYQALKHQLAEVRIELDFVRPLVFGAAISQDPAEISAAKVAAGEAALLASRRALQLHGAIGYTAEFDLGLWILRVRALRGAWGTPAFHRARILEILGRARPGDDLPVESLEQEVV